MLGMKRYSKEYIDACPRGSTLICVHIGSRSARNLL